ncbi:putative phosphoesterase [Gracilibacillus halotolerans]|uniref:Phosphoesterase n=1 Tax=Gracilibacillus halotolerans TaxID=74386 RepID=A0A841RKM7_9BACI|nr:YfcE family phosphodiesterase [Gracilibacillus halotolerans]MBB6512173.1 putative phosphoesterase [Gracilibacillus halotolerans]
MKIAILSDIHGNSVALDAVIKDLRAKKADRIIVLGDIAFRGPEPSRSIDLVRFLTEEVIKGNADEWVVRGVRNGEVPHQALTIMQQEQTWTQEQLQEHQLEYLASLPTELYFEVEGVRFHGFHATPKSLFQNVLQNEADHEIEEKLMKDKEADIYLYGHIHKAYKRIIHGKTVVNVGSVGLPFDGIPKASYVLIDVSNGQVEFHHIRVPYDLEKVCQQYDDYNYPNATKMKNIIQSGNN